MKSEITYIDIDSRLLRPFRFYIGPGLIPYLHLSLNTNKRTLVLVGFEGKIIKRVHRTAIVKESKPNKVDLFDAIVSQFDPDNLEVSKLLLQMLAESELPEAAEKDNV